MMMVFRIFAKKNFGHWLTAANKGQQKVSFVDAPTDPPFSIDKIVEASMCNFNIEAFWVHLKLKWKKIAEICCQFCLRIPRFFSLFKNQCDCYEFVLYACVLFLH